ncbi:hypothetical protein GGX14DRAFT_575118 [Mycena pura]|uniref:Uncharacterized protein n=1 Tax=Mycena pura TaxID=153505 RepID=A0AAD6Y4K3_9AGAR|nr:hypothetical protein GGX14DRAFT_575118 [Mycena pura]
MITISFFFNHHHLFRRTGVEERKFARLKGLLRALNAILSPALPLPARLTRLTGSDSEPATITDNAQDPSRARFAACRRRLHAARCTGARHTGPPPAPAPALPAVSFARCPPQAARVVCCAHSRRQRLAARAHAHVACCPRPLSAARCRIVCCRRMLHTPCCRHSRCPPYLRLFPCPRGPRLAARRPLSSAVSSPLPVARRTLPFARTRCPRSGAPAHVARSRACRPRMSRPLPERRPRTSPPVAQDPPRAQGPVPATGAHRLLHAARTSRKTCRPPFTAFFPKRSRRTKEKAANSWRRRRTSGPCRSPTSRGSEHGHRPARSPSHTERRTPAAQGSKRLGRLPPLAAAASSLLSPKTPRRRIRDTPTPPALDTRRPPPLAHVSSHAAQAVDAAPTPEARVGLTATRARLPSPPRLLHDAHLPAPPSSITRGRGFARHPRRPRPAVCIT